MGVGEDPAVLIDIHEFRIFAGFDDQVDQPVLQLNGKLR